MYQTEVKTKIGEKSDESNCVEKSNGRSSFWRSWKLPVDTTSARFWRNLFISLTDINIWECQLWWVQFIDYFSIWSTWTAEESENSNVKRLVSVSILRDILELVSLVSKEPRKRCRSKNYLTRFNEFKALIFCHFSASVTISELQVPADP